MEYFSIFLALTITVVIVAFIVRSFDKDGQAQRELDKYLNGPLSNAEIGRFYERYIGHLYERDGYDVIYNGAISGFTDLGRDLIVESVDEVFVIQTKRWAKFKLIQEKHIFQLFGSMMHFKLTSEKLGRSVKAVLYTSAKYTDGAQEAARVLGVELKNEELNRSYPMIKCSVNANGDKMYYLPFDSQYDKIKINLHKEEYFVRRVTEAVAKGFRRAS